VSRQVWKHGKCPLACQAVALAEARQVGATRELTHSLELYVCNQFDPVLPILALNKFMTKLAS